MTDDIPEFDFSEHSIMAVRDACRTLLYDPDRMRSLSIRGLGRLANLPGTHSQQSVLNRFIKDPSDISEEKQEIILPLLWAFLHKPMYASVLRISLAKNYATERFDVSQLSLEINAFLNSSSIKKKHDDEASVTEPLRELQPKRPKLDLVKIENLSGYYELIRPHFVFPDERIMICALECGISKDQTEWTLDMHYSTSDKPDVKDTASGHFVPYGGNFLFFGKLDEQVAPFIFIVEPKGSTGADRKPTNAKGTILAGVLGALPSAYPFYLLRVPVKASPREMPLGQFKAEYGDALKDYGLLRGATFWK